MTDTAPIKDFDPARHLTRIKGQDYLQVKWRIAWFRAVHPDGVMETDAHHVDPEAAVFRARVTTPSGATATGWGSCTIAQFPDGYLEKAETKALGRALAALGFGMQFADDFDEGAVVDSPVARDGSSGPADGPARPAAPLSRLTDRRAAAPPRPVATAAEAGYPLATDKQHGMIERRTREAGRTAADVAAYVREQFRCDVPDLGKRDASALIDALAAGDVPPARSHAAAAPSPGTGSGPVRNGGDPVTRFWTIVRKHQITPDQAAFLTIERFGRAPTDLTPDELATVATELEGLSTEELHTSMTKAEKAG